jgi:seryl-tRNA synthetase
MNANELAEAMEIRASIRKKATSRKSVTEGANDRLADQLEQAANMLRQQQTDLNKAIQVIESIANEQVELSHDKIKWQNQDHIRWCKEFLNERK